MVRQPKADWHIGEATVGRRVPKGVKILLVVNCLAILGFAALLFIRPLFTDLHVRMNYTQLDREGVINEDVLSKFHPSYGFAPGNHRNSVPRYIAGDALRAERTNAGIGLAVACTNVALGAWVLLAGRRSLASAKDMES